MRPEQGHRMKQMIPETTTVGVGTAFAAMILNAWIAYGQPQPVTQQSPSQQSISQQPVIPEQVIPEQVIPEQSEASRIKRVTALTLAVGFNFGLLALLYYLIYRDSLTRRQAQIILQERENRLRAIFDTEPECVKLVATDGTLLEINPAGLAILEVDKTGDVIGRPISQMIAPEYQQAFQQFHQQVCQGQKGSLKFEIITAKGNRRWLETHAVPLRLKADQPIVHLAVTQDITRRKQDEVELYRLNRTLRTLTACNQAMVRAKDEFDLLQTICQTIIEVGGYCLAWVGFAEQDAEKSIRPMAQAGYEDGYLQSLDLTWADSDRGRGPTGTALRTRQISIVQNILTDSRYEPWRQEAKHRGYASSIALPLIATDQCFGALSIYATEAEAFDANEVAMLTELARDLAYGIRMLRTQRDRQQAATALRESEERLRLALSATQMGTWDWDLSTNRIIWSEGHERLFGLTVETFDGTYAAFQACIYPADREQFVNALHEARQTETDYTHEFRVVWPDGSIHWLESKGRFFYNATGDPVRMLGTLREITLHKQAEEFLHKAKNDLELRVAERTAELFQINQQLQLELDERKRVQEALRVSQARFAGILDIAGDAIISIDGNQRITLFNQAAEKIFGYSAQEAIGQPLDLLLPSRFAQAHQQNVRDFRQSATQARRMGERREIYGKRKDQTEFSAEASISKLELEDEIIYTVILRDITERRQVERMKDEFISVVSHELRTPLTSIHGSLGMLASGLLKAESEQGKRLLQIAVDSTDRLVRLINDILDIERIESGRVKMEKTRCNVTDLIAKAVNIVQPIANQANITLSVTQSSIELWADPDRIVQTLTNLLSNAIKFSPSNSTVWLTAQLQNHDVLFTVQDRGRGIPANKLDSIFERFQQVDSSDSRNHDGTGLGLAICRSIVQQHEGQIWVDSVLGEGSTFYFTLPASMTSDVGITQLTNTMLPSESNVALQNQGAELSSALSESCAILAPLILVCDDDVSIRSVLQMRLEQQGFRVIMVASGEEAIEQATLQHPDVILLDLQMPEINGWQVMAALKQQPSTREIPIIICSICPPTETQALQSNFADWIRKPLNESLLIQSLKQTLAKTAKPIRVLIVEDDENLANILITLFEQHEIDTFHARTGREAIHLSQKVTPDLLVLDVVLPEGDGFAVVEWLQQHTCLYSTPMVVYSARDLSASERNRLKLGNTEFLTKGRVTVQEFEQRVMGLLQKLTHHKTMKGDYDRSTDLSGG